MKKLLLFLACMTLASVPAIGQIDVAAGNLTVRVRYQGQPIPGECYFYFLFQGGAVNCGGNSFNVPVGNYTLTEGHGYPLPPVPFTITAGQTTVVDVETSGQVGIITGTFLLNGQPPSSAAFVRTGQEDGFSYTDNTGRFRLIALAGPGTGSVNYGLATFPFTAVAGQTVDVGTINRDTGNVNVRIRFQGQPIPGECYFYFTSAAGSVNCGGNMFNVPVGSYTLTEGHGYPIPPVPFTVTAGQTTTVDVETSGQVGIITGIFLQNGQPPANPAFVRTGSEDGLAYTDTNGRFRLIALAGAGTGSINYGAPTFPFTAVAGQTVDVGTITRSSGNAIVNVLYQGQPINGGNCYFYFVSQAGSANCGGPMSNLSVGSYTLTEGHGYPLPPVPFTISAGQTTIINVETSTAAGIISGRFFINGQPPANPAFVRTNREDGLAYTDSTGRFRLLALAGPGIGSINYGLATFAFNAVAGQTRDLGNIGSTTLDSAIVGRSGSLPSKTWTIRVSNTGANSASDVQLTGVTFTAQTFGTACPLPVIQSALPLNGGFLPTGTNTTVPVQLNFGTCPANARFTVKLDYRASGGTVTGTRTFNLQLP